MGWVYEGFDGLWDRLDCLGHCPWRGSLEVAHRPDARRAGDGDWATWLGETGTPDDAKACLKTVEGVKWTMTKEERCNCEAREADGK
jgi:hypothetical protein